MSDFDNIGMCHFPNVLCQSRLQYVANRGISVTFFKYISGGLFIFAVMILTLMHSVESKLSTTITPQLSTTNLEWITSDRGG